MVGLMSEVNRPSDTIEVKKILGSEIDNFEYRLSLARAFSQWELGDPDWAQEIITVFLNPDAYVDEINAYFDDE